MKITRIFPLILLLFSTLITAQRSKIYTNELVDFNQARDLYDSKDYAAAQNIFQEIKDDFSDDSELKARSYYFEAFCAIRRGQRNGEDLMDVFFERFPTSTKRNSAFLEVGEYYFNNRRYAYALKWFSKVNDKNLTVHDEEDFSFKKGYSLFAVGSYSESRNYFSRLLNSEKYGAQSKYYYGYMAYQEDDYEEADRYLNEVADEKAFDEDIDYYLVNIRFKTGKFQEAIDKGLPLLEKSNGIQKSELSKIVGESYFNLKDYEKAIPYLLAYEGKKGKWDNTDFYLLGYAYYQQQDYEQAISWFNKIIDGNNAVSQNAYYHLAECYLKSERKSEALNAFRNAKQMDFDAKIKGDAWLNYAKLSYEIGSPYQSTAEVIQEYLAAYPESEEGQYMRGLLVSAYLSVDDFQGALDYLNTNKAGQGEEFRQVSFLYGHQLFEQGDYAAASEQYTNSIRGASDQLEIAKALYWRAEAQYRQENYESALEDYKSIRDDQAFSHAQEFPYLLYNLGYTFFQLQDYNQAGGHFNEFISSESANKRFTSDSHLRLGDCYFALGNYYKAIPAYQAVLEYNEKDLDYAQLQIAFCLGYSGDRNKKIEALLDFNQVHLKSELRDNAWYELGNTYVQANDKEKALEAYDRVIQQHKQSPLVSKSLLKQGLVYFNDNQAEDAIAKFKTVVRDFPGTEEANEAVQNLKQIYSESGNLAAFESYVKTLEFVDITEEELDNTMYSSAENFFSSADYKKASEGFSKYLERFPNGSQVLNAHFYRAESLEKSGQQEQAIPSYRFLADRDRNPYTERALSRLSSYYLENDNWEQAMVDLKKLETEAQSESNLTFAQSNLMKGYDQSGDVELAVQYANRVLEKENLDERVVADAELILARSSFKAGEFEKARTLFESLDEKAKGELKAETLYYDAFFMNEDGNYKLSNERVQQLAGEYGQYRYWSGKGLVVMAKNFNELEDAYQAVYILESVIEKFGAYEDVVEEARITLNRIKAEQAKTNSSVILEK